jgi:protein O-GlcNAc transferase
VQGPAPGTSGTDAADRLIAEGNQAENDGRLPDACRLYREAAAAAPGYARAHLNLGIGLEAAGQLDAALEAYRSAVSLDPKSAPSNYNLARLLSARGDLTRAAELLRSALEAKPDFPEAWVVLSDVHDSQGDLAAAESALKKALELRPDFIGAWYNLGEVLRKLGRTHDAEASFRRVVDIDPQNADGWYRLGEVISGMGRKDEAEAALRQATAINPTSVPALRLLAVTLHEQLKIDEKLELLARARAGAPGSFAFDSMELLALASSDEISEEELFARHRAFGARLELAFPRRFGSFANEPDPDRRLRIGYVSGDFRFHPVTLFLIPVIERRDRSSCEVHCYSTGESVDEVTSRLASMVDGWHDCANLSDTQLADAINRDGIDVLVDLSGHTGVPCLHVFARQPAPVQATWLGYLSTTGLTRIQYRLCDAHTDPPGMTERVHTETLVRLPHSQWCYRPMVQRDHAVEPPMRKNGFVTFGSFNAPVKISETSQRRWADLLARVPDSRLLIAGVPEGHARNSLLLRFESAGISSARITMVGRVPLAEYFRWFDAVDIALDTTPFSGGTTTCDALWSGVPVVTAPGARPYSRSAASILSTAGLTDWIAPTPEDYVRLAVDFAGKETVIAGLRRSLRQRMRQSPLMDEARFTHDLETAYREMWRAWCNGSST